MQNYKGVGYSVRKSSKALRDHLHKLEVKFMNKMTTWKPLKLILSGKENTENENTNHRLRGEVCQYISDSKLVSKIYKDLLKIICIKMTQ